MLRKAALMLVVAFVPGSVVSAQDSGKLALLIPGLFGPGGLKVDSQARLPDGSTHSAHFNSAFQAEFTQFNIALASQLAAVPLPTPASGFTYTFDSSLGVFQRSTQSFGPILTERAETIGKGKFTFGVTYQHFGFDSLEGLSLGDVPAVFTHDDAQLGGGRSDVVTTSNSIDASVDQTVAFLSYGLGSRLDISVAIPFVTVDLAARSEAPGAARRDATAPPRTTTTTARAASATLETLPQLGPRQRDRRRHRPPQGQPRPQRIRRRWRSGSTDASPPATRTCSDSAPSASSRSRSSPSREAASPPTSTSPTSGTARASSPGTSPPGARRTCPTRSSTRSGGHRRHQPADSRLRLPGHLRHRLARASSSQTFTAANGQAFPQIGFVDRVLQPRERGGRA